MGRELAREPFRNRLSTSILKTRAPAGLKSDMYVEVFNHQGHAVAKLVYSAGVRPGVLSYAVGWRSADFKAGNWVELLTSKYDPLSQTSSYSDAIADIRAWEED